MHSVRHWIKGRQKEKLDLLSRFVVLAEEELKDIGAGFFSDDDEYGMQQVDESMANVHLQTPERPQMNWVAPFK